MPKIIPSLLLWVLLLVGCQAGEPLTVFKSQLQLNAGKGLVFHQNRPFTGTSVEDYPNGQRAASIDYVDGKRNGYYRKWFNDGTLSFESHYLMGKQNGKTTSWWRNGNKRSVSRLRNGIADGLQQQWYVSGAKFKEIALVDGQEEGMQRSWRENGKLYNNYEARNGRIFGLKRANLCFSLDDEVVVLNSETPVK